MADPTDPDKGTKPAAPAAGAGSDPKAQEAKRSGRVGYDERGNSVWEWQLETGVYSRDVSTQRLRKLELGDLSIAETASHQRPPGLGGAPAKPAPGKAQSPAPGGGFNPYDKGASGGEFGSNPYDNSRSMGQRVQPKPPSSPPARKPMDLKRLEEWMNIRKRVLAQKKEVEDD
jgi:hypothetical protein